MEYLSWIGFFVRFLLSSQVCLYVGVSAFPKQIYFQENVLKDSKMQAWKFGTIFIGTDSRKI